MYTIMGITGQVGGATAHALLKAGKKVRGVVRDKVKAASWAAKGVELVVADVQDAASLEKAFQGAEGVFVMVPPNFAPAPGYPETRATVAVLRQVLAKVRPERAVYLSSVGAQQDRGLGLITQSHHLEQEMSSLPMANAFIRAGWFLENYQWDVQSAREQGEINVFLNPMDRVFPMVATNDIGQLAAATLQQTWKGNRYLELEGPQRYSPLDAVAAFSRLLNRPVKAKPIPRDQWNDLFEQQGMPKGRTAPRMEMLDGFNTGWIDFERTGAEPFKGSQTLEDVLRALIQKGV
jgi:NAD(P)H dehydrogenase (quinone)